MIPFWFLTTEVLIFGAVIGSFLNVCIYRLPQHLSLGGRSFCPHCRRQVPWYDNIPLLGYLFLKGRCRSCQKSISIRYPLVELGTALLSLAVFIHTVSLADYFVWFLLFVSPLIVVTFIDFDHQIIPDVISLPGILVGTGVSVYQFWPNWKAALIHSGLGILVGGGFLYLIGTVYLWLRKREGLGGGDVKLCAMLGAFLGWQGALFIFMSSSILGTIYSLFLAIKAKLSQENSEAPFLIPYGPFLVMGALLFYFFGKEIWAYYLSISGLSL